MKQLLALFLTALAINAWAQTNAQGAGARWYQVEVILFSQTDSFRNEANLKSVKLGYPSNRVFLGDSDAALDQELLAKLPPQDARLLTVLVPEDTLKRRDPTLPKAYVPLDRSVRLLNSEASTLERSGTYQVLFHEAWMQPLQGATATPWLIVQGGRKAGSHHELEGSLRFYLDTHLNIQTNLWRTRFGQPGQQGSEADSADTMAATMDSTEQDPARWPELPPPPERPKPGVPGVLTPMLDTSGLVDHSPVEPEQSSFTIEDIDVFQHSQRINSRDLHYLDHPRLGMLIRLTPWVPPGMDGVDEFSDESMDGEDAQIIDEMNVEDGTDGAPLGDDEARD